MMGPFSPLLQNRFSELFYFDDNQDYYFSNRPTSASTSSQEAVRESAPIAGMKKTPTTIRPYACEMLLFTKILKTKGGNHPRICVLYTKKARQFGFVSLRKAHGEEQIFRRIEPPQTYPNKDAPYTSLSESIFLQGQGPSVRHDEECDHGEFHRMVGVETVRNKGADQAPGEC
mmetsp:Transcript_4910/g.7146  ORF Transcript_4910/g.7146 Transcript_4910/m.7146 type:complete len:173 (-) Transcript_4910:867-1385(-)